MSYNVALPNLKSCSYLLLMEFYFVLINFSEKHASWSGEESVLKELELLTTKMLRNYVMIESKNLPKNRRPLG